MEQLTNKLSQPNQASNTVPTGNNMSMRCSNDKDNKELLHRSSFSRRMQRSFRRMKSSIRKITESIQDDRDQTLYIFPDRLSSLTCSTGFSKDEIRRLYRAFKQCCPRGAVTSSNLKPAYAKLFPLGDSTRYTQIVFNAFDKDGDGIVSFNDLLAGIALIVKGNIDQKLSWIFGFYDLNGDGCITRREMLAIISAIYEMVDDGQAAQHAINRHVDRLFEKMDADKDGVISREEFLTSCKNDSVIHGQLVIFNNLWY